MYKDQTFSDFLTPGSDETVISGAALSGGNPAAQAFNAEYNTSGIKTNLIIPLTQVGSGNNAGMKTVVGGSTIQTTQHPVSSSGNVQSSANMGYETGIGWWIGFDQGTPKLFIGDEDGDNMKWTGSSLIITGQLVAGSIDIPDTTSTNSFHVDSSGNSWWGATTLINAPASISNTGEAIFKDYSLLSDFTAGQNLTKGTLACLMNTSATWGNQANSSTNLSTTAIMSAFTYVDSANPAVAEGAALNTVKLGQSGGIFSIYGKLDLTSSPPGLPAWNEIDTINLRIYVVIAAGSSWNSKLSRLTASFTEATVTYNTKPADDGVQWATATVATPTINAEICAATSDLTTTGYIEFDITDLYRLWSQGTYTNNGFVISGSGTGAATIGGRTRTDTSAFNQAPFILSVITKDNPGQGTSFVASDGKAYIASNADYQRVKNILGIVGETTSSGNTVPIYTLANKSVIPSSVVSIINGSVYYLSSSTGTIAPLTNNIIESNKWDRKIGVGTPNGLSIELDTSPVFIRSVGIAASVALLPPPNARYATIATQTTISGTTYFSSLFLEKSFFQSDSATLASGVGVTTVTSGWASGTTGVLSTTGATTATVYWYR